MKKMSLVFVFAFFRFIFFASLERKNRCLSVIFGFILKGGSGGNADDGDDRAFSYAQLQ